MSHRRCCLLLSRLIGQRVPRFVSTSNGYQRCYSKENYIVGTSNSIASPKCTKVDDNKDCVSESWCNSNVNVTLFPQRILADLPDENFLDDRDVTLPKPLDKCTEDLSDIGPYLTPTFTFAKYANESRTIQELLKLGVNLYKLESKEGMVQFILGLDFERDVKPYIRFLHDCGVPADYLGEFITKNPNILKESIDDLHTRIRYLRAHGFSVDMISTIVCKNPNWLLFSTKDIDGRLGYFQHNFQLNGGQIRHLTIKGPKVITYKMLSLMENTFSIKEEMGFDKKQVKELLLRLPRLWTKNRKRLVSVFEYAHNEMQLQHDLLLKSPHILTCRKNRLQQRHLFLVELKKAQYNPSKPLYVSPQALVSGTDVDFCRNIAKTTVHIYNAFLKSF